MLALIVLAIPAGQAIAQGIDFDKVKASGILNIKMDGESIEFEMTPFRSQINPEAQANGILGKYKQKNSDPLNKILKDLNGNERRQANALAALGSMGEAAIPYLDLIFPVLDNKDISLRFNAFWAVVQIAPNEPAAVERIVEFYRTNSQDYPWAALEIISPFKDKLAGVSGDILEAAIKNGHFCMPLAQELLKDTTEGLNSIFIEYLQNPDKEIRKNAAIMAAASRLLIRNPLFLI